MTIGILNISDLALPFNQILIQGVFMRHLMGLYPIFLFIAASCGGVLALVTSDVLVYFGMEITASVTGIANFGALMGALTVTYIMCVESTLEGIREAQVA